MDFAYDNPVYLAMLAHAAREQPREACGLVCETEASERVYVPVANLAAGADQFRMDPSGFAAAEDGFDRIVAIVHSHPFASANPSMADRKGCERSGLPWLIVGWPSGVMKRVEPSGWLAPLRGREFHHGVLDCYTLVQDWYSRELATELPDFEREDGWWEKRADHAEQDLYMAGFGQAGFVRVFGEPQRHDVILMQVRANVANHAAVYLGDGVMLHHLHGRLSCEDVYGGYWQRHTLALVRHRSLIQPAQVAAAA